MVDLLLNPCRRPSLSDHFEMELMGINKEDLRVEGGIRPVEANPPERRPRRRALRKKTKSFHCSCCCLLSLFAPASRWFSESVGKGYPKLFETLSIRLVTLEQCHWHYIDAIPASLLSPSFLLIDMQCIPRKQKERKHRRSCSHTGHGQHRGPVL